MSGTAEASETRSGFGVGTAIRLFAIAIGIVSCTILAWKGLGLHLEPLTVAVLDLVESLIGDLVRPIELLLIAPAIAWINSQGFDIRLYSHWKHAFVLLWLFFGGIARAVSSLGYRGRDRVFAWIWGALSALAAGAMAGTASLAHWDIFWWPVAGICLYWVGLAAWVSLTDSDLRGRGRYFMNYLRRGVITFAPVALFALAFVYLALVRLPVRGLAALAVMMIGFALRLLISGVLVRGGDGRTWWARLWNDIDLRIGLDMLAVLGGATAIVTINQLLIGS